MLTSELIEKLQESMNWNGDLKVTVMIYGKPFHDVEVNVEGDEVYIEGYLPKGSLEEDIFIKQNTYSGWRE